MAVTRYRKFYRPLNVAAEVAGTIPCTRKSHALHRQSHRSRTITVLLKSSFFISINPFPTSRPEGTSRLVTLKLNVETLTLKKETLARFLHFNRFPCDNMI